MVGVGIAVVCAAHFNQQEMLLGCWSHRSKLTPSAPPGVNKLTPIDAFLS